MLIICLSTQITERQGTAFSHHQQGRKEGLPILPCAGEPDKDRGTSTVDVDLVTVKVRGGMLTESTVGLRKLTDVLHKQSRTSLITLIT